MLKKFLVLVIILALTAVYPSMALADDVQSEVNQEIENDDEIGKGTLKEWKIDRNNLMSNRRELQDQFGELGLKIEGLEKQLEEAEEAEDNNLIKDLKSEIEDLKLQMKDLKANMMEIIEEMKASMKSKYSEEDLKNLEKVGQSLKEKVDAVLPVENILTEKEVKFDTPPVIKYGRTLIPLRAVAEGMGTEVTYDADKQIVTIVNEEVSKTIVLDLANGTVKVNDEEAVKIDVPAEIMNNRTMVPLRFIAEQLGLKVQWNQETQTVAIEE